MKKGRLENLCGQNSFKQILLVSFLPLGLPLYQLYFRKQVKNCLWRDIFRDVVNARLLLLDVVPHYSVTRFSIDGKTYVKPCTECYGTVLNGPLRRSSSEWYDTSSWFDLQTFDFNYLSSLLFTSSSITFLPSYEL